MESPEDIGIEELRALTRQEYSLQRQFESRSYFEAARRRAFEPGDVGDLFYENTKIDQVWNYEVSATMDAIGGETKRLLPFLDPDYPGAETVELPTDVTVDAEFGGVLTDRRTVRDFDGESVTLPELSALLRYGAGTSGPPDPVQRRTYASPGALYPTELYLAALDVDGLRPGLYYYRPDPHELRVLERTDRSAMVEEIRDRFVAGPTELPTVSEVPVVVMLTGAFSRLKFKYGPRGHRYVFLEAGHLAQNLLLAATAADLAGVPYGGFRDDAVNDLLGVDGVDEGIIYSIMVGHPSEAAGPTEPFGGLT